jgi:hypothetical protein
VKEEIMAGISPSHHMMKVYVKSMKCHKVYSKIDVSFMAEKSLKELEGLKTKKICER